MGRKSNLSLKFRKRELVRMTGPICFYCEKEFSISSLTLDHLFPKQITNGHNTNHITNLVLSCYACNHVKGNQMPTFGQIEKARKLHGSLKHYDLSMKYLPPLN